MHSEYDLHSGRPLFPEVASPIVRTTSSRGRKLRSRDPFVSSREVVHVVQHPMGDILEPKRVLGQVEENSLRKQTTYERRDKRSNRESDEEKKRKKRGKKKRKSGSEVKWVSGESQEHCYRMSLSPLAEDRGNWIEEIEHPFATLTSPMCFRKRAWIYRRLESLLGRVSLGYTLFEIRPL